MWGANSIKKELRRSGFISKMAIFAAVSKVSALYHTVFCTKHRRFTIPEAYLFIEDFVKALDRYEANRDKYPTLADFMPELAKVHNNLDVDSIISDIRARQPQFVSCNIADDAILPPGPTKITIRFSRPIIYGQGLGMFNGREFPKSENSSTSWNDDRTEFTYTVTLKPSTKYGIMYPGVWFKSKECYTTVGTYLLPFETSAE